MCFSSAWVRVVHSSRLWIRRFDPSCWQGHVTNRTTLVDGIVFCESTVQCLWTVELKRELRERRAAVLLKLWIVHIATSAISNKNNIYEYFYNNCAHIKGAKVFVQYLSKARTTPLVTSSFYEWQSGRIG